MYMKTLFTKCFPSSISEKYVLFYSALWPCYLPPLSLDYYISYENSSIEQVWVSEWSVEMFTIPAYKERHEGGCSHRPVIMESTLLSAYHRLSDPNKCILSSHVYLALLLAFFYIVMWRMIESVQECEGHIKTNRLSSILRAFLCTLWNILRNTCFCYWHSIFSLYNFCVFRGEAWHIKWKMKKSDMNGKY